jgi:hypothetical protein
MVFKCRESGMNARSAIALVVILGASPAAFAQGTAPEKLDVVGIRLGMTEAEVRGALKAFDPELKIAAVTGVFNYSDGVNHALKTPGFLDRLEAGNGNQGASIKVCFSGPEVLNAMRPRMPGTSRMARP